MEGLIQKGQTSTQAPKAWVSKAKRGKHRAAKGALMTQPQKPHVKTVLQNTNCHQGWK